MYRNSVILSILIILFSLSVSTAQAAASKSAPHPEDNSDEILKFDDTMLEEELVYPDWFKSSSGDLREDLAEAKKAGKKGIITYFGQKRCAYCEQFINTSLSDHDIQNYLTKYYDVIAFDIWGIDDIIDTDGKQYTERELSVKYKTNFTPSLVFYDIDGTPVFRLRGYYLPYKFRAALQYVTEMFYKSEKFADYFARANPGEYFLLGGLNERDFFLQPPYDLPALQKNKKTTAVFFEQGNCHACDLLHSGPLAREETIAEMEQMNVIQLNMWSDTKVTTPKGRQTTAKKWARKLDIFYAPSIVFFDEKGNEIIRLDSVTQFYRLYGVLEYVNQKGYEKSDSYQDWRIRQREVSQ